MRYYAFGCLLESDEPIPELPVAGTPGDPRFTITWHARAECPDDLRWHEVWKASGGDAEVSFARGTGASFVRFGGVALVTIGGGRITIAAGRPADPGLRHLLLDQILPLALAAEGETILHASAVEADGGALLFLGGAGAGKSTLAAALSARGAPVLSDDGVLIEARGEDVWAVPSYRGLRLWPDAAARAGARGFSLAPAAAPSSKRRFVPAAQDCAPALPIAAVYTLHPGAGAPDFRKLSRRDAALELVRHAFTTDVDSRGAIRAHLDRAVRWSGRLEVWRLDAPRDLSRLPQVADAIVAHARSHRDIC